MRRVALVLAACLTMLAEAGLWAQEADSVVPAINPPAASQSVPRLIMFSGAVKDLAGKPLTGPADLSFAIYKEQADAAPLWQESQTLNLDEQGHYTVLLGAMQPEGLPVDLFTSGEARWLGVSVGKLPEQPRVLLVSVPYALKANDAEMLAGKPASAYMLAPAAESATSQGPGTAGATGPRGAATPDVAAPGKPKSGPKPNLAGAGTQYYIPLWTDSAGTLGNSVIYQSSGLVGIGTTTPAAKLDVAGYVGHFLVDTSGAQFKFTRGGANYFWASSAGGYFDFVANGLTPSDANASLKLAANGVVNFMAGNVGIGTLTPAQKLDVAGNIKSSGTLAGTQLISTVATGTAPLSVASTTLVSNLNADTVDGFHASAFQPVGSYATLGANTFTGTETVNGQLNVGSTGQYQVNSSGVVAEYNGQATAGVGLGAVVGVVNLLNKTASIATTTFATPSGTGLYHLMADLFVTTNPSGCSGSPTYPSGTVQVSANTDSGDLLHYTSSTLSWPLNPVVVLNGPIEVKGGTNVVYDVSWTAATGCTTAGDYGVRIRLVAY